MSISLFTNPPEPIPAKKLSFEEVWLVYKDSRDAIFATGIS